MGVYHTIAIKVGGQIKPAELGEEAEQEIIRYLESYRLTILENKSGFIADGYSRDKDYTAKRLETIRGNVTVEEKKP